MVLRGYRRWRTTAHTLTCFNIFTPLHNEEDERIKRLDSGKLSTTRRFQRLLFGHRHPLCCGVVELQIQSMGCDVLNDGRAFASIRVRNKAIFRDKSRTPLMMSPNIAEGVWGLCTPLCEMNDTCATVDEDSAFESELFRIPFEPGPHIDAS